MSRFTSSGPPPVPREGAHPDPDFRPPDGGTAVAAPGLLADDRGPVGGDLNRRADDGCPVGSDPAPRTDPDWRDNLGEWDTFDDEVGMGFPAASRPAVRTRRVPGHPSPATDRRAPPLDCPDCG